MHAAGDVDAAADDVVVALVARQVARTFPPTTEITFPGTNKPLVELPVVTAPNDTLTAELLTQEHMADDALGKENNREHVHSEDAASDIPPKSVPAENEINTEAPLAAKYAFFRVGAGNGWEELTIDTVAVLNLVICTLFALYNMEPVPVTDRVIRHEAEYEDNADNTKDPDS